MNFHKSIITSLVLFLFQSSTLFAQNYAEKGFSFQSYARNADGAALSAQNITVRFTITNSATNLPEYTEIQTLTTDPFGVFRAIVGGENSNVSDEFTALSFGAVNYELLVEVSPDGSTFTTISNQELLSVPYAKSADNGVPVGGIIPFAGTTPPAGWLLCNGQDATAYPELVGVMGQNNVPDLRNQFLRGNPASGRALLSSQGDAFQQHRHPHGHTTQPVNDLLTDDNDPNSHHRHQIITRGVDANGNNSSTGRQIRGNGPQRTDDYTPTNDAESEHRHRFDIPSLTVNISAGEAQPSHGLTPRTSDETRPVNISVNFIIRAR